MFAVIILRGQDTGDTRAGSDQSHPSRVEELTSDCLWSTGPGVRICWMTFGCHMSCSRDQQRLIVAMWCNAAWQRDTLSRSQGHWSESAVISAAVWWGWLQHCDRSDAAARLSWERTRCEIMKVWSLDSIKCIKLILVSPRVEMFVCKILCFKRIGNLPLKIHR